MLLSEERERERESRLVSWCFKPSQPERDRERERATHTITELQDHNGVKNMKRNICFLANFYSVKFKLCMVVRCVDMLMLAFLKTCNM